VANVAQADVTVVAGKAPDAYAVDIGLLTRVVLTEGLIERLTPAEIRAVIAHEDAHACVYRDALLSTVIPLVASLFLVGQSTLLGLLDYRRRELRADRHAAEVTSVEALASALERLSPPSDGGGRQVDSHKTAGRHPRLGQHPSFAPLSSPDRSESNRPQLTSYFAPLFSAFAVVEAHPSLSDRLDALEARV
jgi:Zn-dependent protease with chaperone function